MTTRIMVIHNSADMLGLSEEIWATDDCQVLPRLFLDSALREVRAVQPSLIILDYDVSRETFTWGASRSLRRKKTRAVAPIHICITAAKLNQETADYRVSKLVTLLFIPRVQAVFS